MLACPFCEAELKYEDKKGEGWQCACGEFVPDGLAVDTECRRCGGVKHE
ncbi:MAG TPA: hypothetical protein VGB23_09335 [Nitrospirota bacterium]